MLIRALLPTILLAQTLAEAIPRYTPADRSALAEADDTQLVFALDSPDEGVTPEGLPKFSAKPKWPRPPKHPRPPHPRLPHPPQHSDKTIYQFISSDPKYVQPISPSA